jgi:hypothetical protein
MWNGVCPIRPTATPVDPHLNSNSKTHRLKHFRFPQIQPVTIVLLGE